jgi:hypothetical protein
MGNLNSGNSSDDLSSYAARFRRRRAKTDKGFPLDFVPRSCVCRQPSVRILILSCALLNVHEFLVSRVPTNDEIKAR